MTTDELKLLAAQLQAVHKVNGVVIIVFEQSQTPFGFAWKDIDKELLGRAAPGKLREIADVMERGMPLTSYVTELE